MNELLVVTPNGYKASKLYSIVPTDGSGDLTWVRNTIATRVNSSGLIESVSANVPRLDYSGGVTCPCILVEPQRTNICLRSEELDDATWLKLNAGTGTTPSVTPDYSISPDGTSTADRVQFSNVGGSGSDSNYSLILQVSLTLSSTGTASFYLKSNTVLNQNVLFYWAGGQGQVFVVTPQWQRFYLNNLTPTTTGIAIGTRGGVGSYISGGDEVIDISVWGLQVEEGLIESSYIPTTSASQTRNADVATVTTPVGVTSLIETYEDGTTNVVSPIPVTYQMSEGRISKVVGL